MPKTIKKRVSTSGVVSAAATNMKCSSVHETTYKGLTIWYKEKFESLGWMILAKEYGYTDKLAAYKMSLARLLCALENKIAKMKDSDKKDDLKIMQKNVMVLMAHANHDF
jgi:hypothetical protein